MIALCAFALVAAAKPADKPAAGKNEPLPTIAKRTKALRAMPGLFPLFWDERKGSLWLEVDRFDEDVLLVSSLAGGMGSNDIGLDRGQLGEPRVVRFHRSGPRVLLVQQNLDFRSSSRDPAERRAVEDSFAKSVLAGFEVGAEEGGHALVDATAFFTSDLHGVADAIKRARQGAYKLDGDRSAIELSGTKNFPKNTEVEALLTFAGDEPGKFVQDVTPNPKAVTVRAHFSLVELPGPGYQMRAYDPRSGYYPIESTDLSAPVGQSTRVRLIARHRLAGKPIVYYLDRGVPEPVRSALLEGARWWTQAFEAAGLRDAFRVELMPEGADPLDVRFNVIQWVHRATRGWSYGAGVIDPRTGEIIRGRVTLGSLRVRQDYLIFEGLLGPHKDAGDDPRPLQLALARMRQLAAHEVGHTLGLAHNFVASTGGRASVMDYPHPLVKLAADGSFDTADAYATGIGEWDKVAIAFGYGDGDRDQLLDDARRRGLWFLSDQDARPPGSASPAAHLWDNGANAVDELGRVMQVRARALAQFGEESVRRREPLAGLAEVLVPVYLFHRYQTEAAAKSIGGVAYGYSLRGDGGATPAAPVAAAEQRRALAAVLATLSPDALTLPDRVLRLLPPHPMGYERTRESFPASTGLTFDPLGAAESAAGLAVKLLLDPERAARLAQQHAADGQMPSFAEVIHALLAATWKAPPRSGAARAVQRAVDDVALAELASVAASEQAAPEVRAAALLKLQDLARWAATGQPADDEERAHRLWAVQLARRFEQEPFQLLKPTPPPTPPPGQPIGSWSCGDGF